MEHEPGLLESRCASKIDGGSHGFAPRPEKEATDTAPEEQPFGKEACYRSSISHDTGRSTF